MTDRELLELAAKACGLEEAKMRIEFNQWNPLEDDGDALRLAVKLNLPIVRSKITDARLPVVACYKVYVDVHEEERWQWEFVEDDPYAATRRAITRAAAEIGRNMK